MTARSTRRRGQSLVQMLVYISLVSTLLSLISGMLYSGYRAHTMTSQWHVAVQQRSRLARMLSDDVHASAEARRLGADQPLRQQRLQLTHRDGTTIEYAWDDPFVTRVEQQGEQLVRQEAFARVSAAAPRWTVTEASGQVILELFPSQAGPPQRLGAQLNRDARFAGANEP